MRRLVAGLAGAAMIASGVALGQPGAAAAPSANATDSAMTKSGRGEFADLRVTVSQTENLVNQIVRVSWTGGRPTNPEFGNLNTNYIQIMQCWGGTPEDGPPREQCQYGSLKSSTGGQNTNSRQMTTAGVIDPLETDYEANAVGALAYIPFDSWTGKRTIGPRSEFFDRNTSNESNHNRTRSDGTGEDFFEIQTGVEAPGLGCGQVRNNESPLCWLVVVPRGEAEVDGTPRGRAYFDPLDTSPLLTSNWQNRIVFPLQFQPIGAGCALGNSETPLLGSDRIAEAVTRWQPVICGIAKTNFSFTVIPDSLVRNKLVSSKSDLGFTNFGVSPAENAGKPPIVYAPVALSGLSIAFNVESQSSSLAPESVRARDGQRVGDIKITPRLLAKLLTQTYRFDAEPQPGNVEKNPFDISQDPEFLEINPQFEGLRFPGLGHILVVATPSDSSRLVWEYIWADKEARDFLRGKPDEWGTRVNPRYRSVAFPRSDFPREDNQCRTYSDKPVPVCTFDLIPYVGDLGTAARAASRGATLANGIFDPAAIPPGWKRSPLQEPGRRAMVVITDSALVSRFSLTPALLRNAAGEFIAMDESSIRKAAAAAKPTDVAGIVQPDPGAKVKGAYPLVSYTYAATTPSTLTEDQGRAYADLLEYAAGPGQVVGENQGQLPRGYVPLSDRERAIAVAAAKTIRADAGKAADPLPSPEPTPSPTTPPTTPPSEPGSSGGSSGLPSGGGGYTDPGSGAGSGSGSAGAGDTDEQSAPESEESAQPTPADDTAMSTDIGPVVEASGPATPASPLGPIRYLVVLLLIVGGLALAGGAVVAQVGRSRVATP